MARSYPANTRLQWFFQEQYDKETAARLQAYRAAKGGTADKLTLGPESAGPRLGPGDNPDGLPKINPQVFAREMQLRERVEMAKMIKDARRNQSKEEMQPATAGTKDKLYEGFTKEGKGRYAYLKERHEVIPEKKYAFPVTSSWKYGWKLDEAFQLQKPRFARSRKMMDTFYTRNGIPDMYCPPIERAYTSIY